MKHFTAWSIHTEGLNTLLKTALERGEIEPDDTVWTGPSGDAVVASDAAELTPVEDDDPDYGEYMDAGLVSDYGD